MPKASTDDEELLKIVKKRKIHLIEDVCESHGAKFKEKNWERLA